MNILGVACGNGIPLFAAKKLGYEVLGNYEWRGIGRDTFAANFPEAFYTSKDTCKNISELDVVIGHPKCSSFSQYNLYTNKNRGHVDQSQDHIPRFIDKVKELGPRVFFMDNLTKSLEVFTIGWYRKKLKAYTIGHCVYRHSRFMDTAKRERLLVWGFKSPAIEKKFANLYNKNMPNKAPRPFRLIVQDLPLNKDVPSLDHIHHISKRFTPANKTRMAAYIKMKGFTRPLKEFMLGINPDPRCAYMGWRRLNKDQVASVLVNKLHHPLTGKLLTIAEMRRAYSVPDDFIMKGAYDNKGKQIVKTIPYVVSYYILETLKKVMK